MKENRLPPGNAINGCRRKVPQCSANAGCLQAITIQHSLRKGASRPIRELIECPALPQITERSRQHPGNPSHWHTQKRQTAHNSANGMRLKQFLLSHPRSIHPHHPDTRKAKLQQMNKILTILNQGQMFWENPLRHQRTRKNTSSWT